jgi:4-hydroxy-4-methyl-2-oxoglutarate aldolase
MEHQPAASRIINNDMLAALRRLDTCTVANAIERFRLRLRNTGFTNSSIHCVFEDFPPLVGYAATARMRSGEPPIAGRMFRDHTPLWNSIQQAPAPRIAVFEDVDNPPGVGAFLGDVHAAILRALGCVGYVTNGAVRELPRVRELGLQLFAGNVAVSHAYAHIFDFGNPVMIGGLEIQQGDLLHGDRHGLLNIPAGVAAELPAIAVALQQRERSIVEFCQSGDFSPEKLERLIQETYKPELDESRRRDGARPERGR